MKFIIFRGGGLRFTQSDYVNARNNRIHHNTSRASVGTHGLVAEGLTPQSGDNSSNLKMTIAGNLIYSNYNEIYSWVQSKVIVTTAIDEGKGLALLRTSPLESGFNGLIRVENNIAYDNGKSGLHANDVNNAEIINNTVYQNAHSNIYNSDISEGTNAGISLQSSDYIKIINNIIVVPNLTHPVQALSEGQSCDFETVSNNIIWGGAASDFAGGYTLADPLFTDMANNVVTLSSGSPAIDAGSAAVAPLTDYNGLNRNSPPEIGAYEFPLSLPVKLGDFKLIKCANKQVKLVWTTENEINHKEFQIERSADGLDWQTIGTVAGNGNFSSIQNYSFLDLHSLPQTNYYRLKQIDYDGHYTYSNILSLNLSEENEISIYPNPFSSSIFLKNLKAADEISILDTKGQLIQCLKLNNLNQVETLELALGFLADGIYLLKIGNVVEKINKINE